MSREMISIKQNRQGDKPCLFCLLQFYLLQLHRPDFKPCLIRIIDKEFIIGF